MSSQQTQPKSTFSTNSAIRALASVAVGALVFGLVLGLRRDKTTTTDRVVARPASAAAKQRPPNLIVFLADDLGRNDVGYAHRDGGPGRIASPRIDALAAESLVLDRFYAQPMCTPTRAALMTGRHAYRTGLAYFVLLANQGTGLPAAEVTVAERLRDAGYSTHMIGKWHLGFAKKAMLPTSRGFDRFFGYCLGTDRATGAEPPTTGGMGHDLWDGATPLPRTPKTENVHSADLFAARATETFATAPRDKPLFLYYASQAPHAHFVGAPPRHVAAAAAMGFAAGDPRADVAALVAALDEQDAATPRTLVLAYDAVNGCGAAVRGRFKYVLNAACGSLSPDYAGWEGDERAPFDACATRECLFDLERDPEERADVAAAHPGALDALRAALLAAEAASVPSLVEITPGDDRAAPDRHGGSWVSWLD
ncbi:sulfuric ester hydrolase [Aureococcus anophagefferens]|nr:sulfuric ester hydrolase [Aureococcus anophagefferens]